MGYISNQELIEYLQKQKETKKKLGELIIQDGKINEDILYKILSDEFNVRFIDSLPEPDPQKIALLFSILTMNFCQEKAVAPLDISKEFIIVAVDDPSNFELVNEIRFITGKHVEIKFAKTSTIKEYLELAQNIMFNAKYNTIENQKLQTKKEKTEISKKSTQVKEESKVISAVDSIIRDAIDRNASDIHLEIYDNDAILRYRIDGKLHRIETTLIDIYPAIVSRIKIMSNLDISERRLPQDGSIKFIHREKEVDIRVSIIPGIFGENVVMRILSKDTKVISDIANIGMEPWEIEIYKKHLSKSNGMIIVTGPTGSGKTTSLYAGILYIKKFEKKIITAEDPVEYQINGIEQIQINTDIGFTFAEALKAFLRHDPDIIMVGEIRDLETAEIAIRSALTGHLVLSTLHTNDAPSSLTRLVDMGIPPYLVASTVSLVIAQRLVRKLCIHCKKFVVLTAQEISKNEMLSTYFKPGDMIYLPEGCPKCNKTGFLGRIPIFEILEITPEIKELLLKSVSSFELKDISKKLGMKTLIDSGIEKVKKGITALEEVMGAV